VALAHKVRVLQVIKGMDIGGIHGGAERFAIELSGALDASFFDVSIFIWSRSNTKVEKFWLEKTRDRKMKVFVNEVEENTNRFLKLFSALKSLWIICSQNSFDIIHSHFQMGTVSGMILKLMGKTKCVIRSVHLVSEIGYDFYGKVLYHLFIKWLFPLYLDAEVAVSTAAFESLRLNPGRKFSKNYLTMIHNAISFPTTPSSKKLFEKETFIIGSASRLTKQKGLVYLIQAAKLVCMDYPQIRFEIVGEGELRDELEKIVVDLGISDNVLFYGTHQNIYQFLENIDLLVLPSLWEGLPTIVLESMAAGTPIIATDIPGTNELIENHKNGWLVPPQDAKALADSIVYLFLHPELRNAMVNEAKQHVHKFSIDAIARKYENVYKQMIQHNYGFLTK
jgi:glycosyltransferase involved in cell wall biosynthesis